MARAPKVIQYVTLLDGALAGRRIPRASLPRGPRFFVFQFSKSKKSTLERHEYELDGLSSAKWVRFVDEQPWVDPR